MWMCVSNRYTSYSFYLTLLYDPYSLRSGLAQWSSARHNATRSRVRLPLALQFQLLLFSYFIQFGFYCTMQLIQFGVYFNHHIHKSCITRYSNLRKCE